MGKNPLDVGSPQSQQESKLKYLSAVSKNDRMISARFQGKPFNITVIQVCAPTTDVEEADQFYEDQEDLLELTPKKDVLFIIGD